MSVSFSSLQVHQGCEGFQSYRSNLEMLNRTALTALSGGFTTSEVAGGLRVDVPATLTNNEKQLCLISQLDSALIASSPICLLEKFVPD